MALVHVPRPAGGVSVHGEGCECARCTGFVEGHGLSVTHGGTSSVALRVRAEAFAAELEEELVKLGVYEPVDRFLVDTAGLMLARKEQAVTRLEQLAEKHERGEIEWQFLLEAEGKAGEALDRAAGAIHRMMNSLAASPKARSEVLRNMGIGRAASERASRERLAAHVRERYAGEVAEGSSASSEG